ncbi:calcium transporter, putative [Talaromyces stipitatus ATCC 10500]|uniref:Calcium transporter, putative n=1 Tax=Talaromyces stipitatus (strain ATCC 10500 / CBS 375.48 / QM 6759 / NRRL 1006) TaxID=441959 RepID=B8LVV0_TALSN|nr:calcium transporter, putative [Talaromyces stipitatus ATCC 10500]EED24316.1 calcium transporter, putative [Talaromyces stipitatus ATCC 10500]
MALLFLKNKLFPSWNQSDRDKNQRKGTWAKKSASPSPDLRRPLLIYDSDNIDGSTVDGSDTDIEAQMNGSYSTFAGTNNGDNHNRDDASVRSNESGNRSRINPRLISDAILGLSDGLTVPFALSAGLSAIGDTKVVVLGGLAELIAGAISMGLGGYVGAKSELESYEATVREVNEILDHPGETRAMVTSTFANYNLSPGAIDEITNSLQAEPEKLRDFLLTFHHRESKPDCNQAYMSALTLTLGYFIGGFIPLIPYFIANQVYTAFMSSVIVMAVTLFAFGYVKTCIVRGWKGGANIWAGVMGGIQMCVVGGLAAGAAVALVKLINSDGNV